MSTYSHNELAELGVHAWDFVFYEFFCRLLGFEQICNKVVVVFSVAIQIGAVRSYVL